MIEDLRDNPTRRSFERDDADELHDAEKDRQAERYATLHPARPNGPCARAVARAEARMNGEPTEAMFEGCDSIWGLAQQLRASVDAFHGGGL